MTKIFKAVNNGYFYNKQRYNWDQYGSMFFDLESILQQLQYAKKYCSLDITGAQIIEFDMVEVARHEIIFAPEVETGENFENIT